MRGGPYGHAPQRMLAIEGRTLNPIHGPSASGTAVPMLRSFWVAGFDGIDHFDGAQATQNATAYRDQVEADYRSAREAGIACVRESVGWRRVARRNDFDFSSLTVRAQAARRAGLQIVWTLCHRGWPDDVDVGAASFVERFRTFAGAVARALAPYSGAEPAVYTPINAISFLSFALANTDWLGPRRSDLAGGDRELERQLVRAALAACDAIAAIDPRARFLHREPAMPRAAWTAGGSVALGVRFSAWDMLAGRLEPRLGGHPRYLDAIGVHIRETPQWRTASDGSAASATQAPLSGLLENLHARYRCPIVVSETNRTSGRAAWLRDFGAEIGEALEHGVPVIGACLCRAVERPAWKDPRPRRERRLWDMPLLAVDEFPRVPDSAYERVLRDVGARVGAHPLHR